MLHPSELCLTRGTTNTSAKALSTFKIYSLSGENYRKVLKRFNTPKKQKQFGVRWTMLFPRGIFNGQNLLDQSEKTKLCRTSAAAIVVVYENKVVLS
jgi:hypothetical protein